jgi:pimeloyl-ACP methyl ester carboxylesterase
MGIEAPRRTIRVSGAEEPVTLSVIDIPPNGPQRTMVFVHGLGGEAGNWRHQLSYFANGARLIAPDLRGHGGSEQPRHGYSVYHFRADLEAVTDALGVQRAVLIAHSFGGAIAAEVAARRPDLVEAMVLISTPARFRLRLRWRFALGLPTMLLSALLPLARGRVAASAYVLRRCYQEAMLPWSGPRTLGTLTTPALVIYGDRDPTVDFRWLEETARAIPGAQRLRIHGAGHLPMRDDAEEVNRAIQDFLGVHAPGGPLAG